VNPTVQTKPQASDAVGASHTSLIGPDLRRTASNIGVAILFFVTLLPRAAQYGSALADWIWMIGAALMGLLALVRVAPTATAIDVRSIVATATMMLAPPLLLNNHSPSTGLLASGAIAIELIGVIVSQGARFSLGRKFALLPANRGIVRRGPFALIRHPIYAGWVILTAGYVMAYPNLRNALALMVTIPFMIWRISLEEDLLKLDPAYRAYCATTRWRLVPFLY
jgi:protein-S-isoprenylcysteine O-methyltransferase Ste14